MPITMTASVCMVIGTGQNGICVRADAVSSTEPTTIAPSAYPVRMAQCTGADAASFLNELMVEMSFVSLNNRPFLDQRGP